MNARAAAAAYLARGWMPIPVSHRQKRPTLAGWPQLRVSESTLDQYFNGQPQNVGVLMGEPSGGLTDADLDAREALALADDFLPPTESVFGRKSKPGSHRLYRADPAIETVRFQDIDGATLLELRSTGGQTMFPCSTHPNGE